MTAERIAELRGLGETVSWLEEGELEELLDLAGWALKEQAKARARLEKYRSKKRDPKIAQNGRKGAKKGSGGSKTRERAKIRVGQILAGTTVGRYLEGKPKPAAGEAFRMVPQFRDAKRGKL